MFQKIGEMLLDAGLITERQLIAALEYQKHHGGRLGAALLDSGVISEEAFMSFLGRQLNAATVVLSRATIDLSLLGKISQRDAEHELALPLAMDGDRLKIAVADPTLGPVVRLLAERESIQPVIAADHLLRRAIARAHVLYAEGGRGVTALPELLGQAKEAARTILVVDDEETLATLLATGLSRVGYRTLVAANGAEGLELCLREGPDLVVLDVRMPKMDGLEACRQMKAHARTKGAFLPVILLTAKDRLEDKIEGFEAGADEYLIKPIRLQELEMRVRALMQQKRLQDALAKEKLHAETICLELERANRRLSDLDSTKSEFIAVASHELRTPLAAISGALELLLEGKTGPLTSTQQQFIGNAKRNADRLSRLVGGLLDLTRIEKGHVELHVELLDLHELVERCLKTLAIEAQARQVQLQSQHAEVMSRLPPLPSMMADVDGVEQILLNLIGNAIKFSPEDSTVQVELAVMPAAALPETMTHLNAGLDVSQYACVRVVDEGPGIPTDKRAVIFDKFVQVENSLTRRVGGAGLGLAIAKSMADAHGGAIWVEDGPTGRGSIFSLVLPILSTEQALEQALAHEVAAARRASLNLAVLYVEFVPATEMTVALATMEGFTSRRDRLCRIPNDRGFAIILRDVDRAQAVQVERRLISRCAEESLGVQRVTLACYPSEADDARALARLIRQTNSQ